MANESRVHARNLVSWAETRPDVIVLSADLTNSVELDLFKAAYPDRFFSMGIAEQNMLSWAGGLAREGFIPFVHTFGVFIYRRAYDQLAMSVAYPNLPVKMFGFLPGVMTPGGATHQAIEDIAVLRALPNLTILECGDATEVESVLDAVVSVPGPVYVRMLRGEIPRLFPASEPLRLDRARILSQGDDVVLFSSGICTEEALKAVSLLRQQGLSIAHLHISTLKPFTDPMITDFAARAKYGVITMENHSILGGLGTAVAERMAAAGIGCKLHKMGIADRFLHGASRDYLLRENDLDAPALVKRVEKLCGRDFGSGRNSLSTAAVEVRSAELPPEDL